MRTKSVFFFRHAFFLFLVLSSFSVYAQSSVAAREALEERIDQLEREIEDLKRQKEAEHKDGTLEPLERPEEKSPPHRPSPPGGSGGVMNPDLSAVVDVQALFTDDQANPDRNKVRIKEVEVALQGYLYPGIRADVIPTLEMLYEEDGQVEVEVDLEEAYLSVFEIPYLSERVPLEFQAGRKLMHFGRLNVVHPHHWPFADTPLVLANFFGEHPWYDDGIQGSLRIPNPLDWYCKTTFGFWNGRSLSHAHSHGHEEEHDQADEQESEADHHEHAHRHPLTWNGHVYLSRIVLGIPLSHRADSLLGYSVAWDESRDTVLHGADLTLTFRFPETFRRVRWQSEFLAADRSKGETTRYGGYSLLVLNLDRSWQVGYRYDRAQPLDPHENKSEWAASGFITHFFSHSLYVRGQYRFRRTVRDAGEHTGIVQLVFGLGPHSHRLED